jgi:hypothetical protein
MWCMPVIPVLRGPRQAQGQPGLCVETSPHQNQNLL